MVPSGNGIDWRRTATVILKNLFFLECDFAALQKDPYQVQMHVLAAKIVIVQKHVVIIWMIAGRQGPTHELGKGVPMIKIRGFHQLHLVGMATKNILYFVLMHKVNQDG